MPGNSNEDQRAVLEKCFDIKENSDAYLSAIFAEGTMEDRAKLMRYDHTNWEYYSLEDRRNLRKQPHYYYAKTPAEARPPLLE